MAVKTEVGRALLSGFGDEARFYSAHQFTLDRDGAGGWALTHNGAAAHSTLVNGRSAVGPVRLKVGDVIGVGDEGKRIVKLPLTVRFE